MEGRGQGNRDKGHNHTKCALTETRVGKFDAHTNTQHRQRRKRGAGNGIDRIGLPIEAHQERNMDGLSGVGALCLNQSLFGSGAQQLQASSCKGNHFALALIYLLLVRLEVFIGDRLDHLHNIFGVGDVSDELLVFGLKQLQKSPDSDVLEGGISACEETLEVAVDAAVRVCPVANED